MPAIKLNTPFVVNAKNVKRHMKLMGETGFDSSGIQQRRKQPEDELKSLGETMSLSLKKAERPTRFIHGRKFKLKYRLCH
jgi:hypothetical protein